MDIRLEVQGEMASLRDASTRLALNAKCSLACEGRIATRSNSAATEGRAVGRRYPTRVPSGIQPAAWACAWPAIFHLQECRAGRNRNPCTVHPLWVFEPGHMDAHGEEAPLLERDRNTFHGVEAGRPAQARGGASPTTNAGIVEYVPAIPDLFLQGKVRDGTKEEEAHPSMAGIRVRQTERELQASPNEVGVQAGHHQTQQGTVMSIIKVPKEVSDARLALCKVCPHRRENIDGYYKRFIKKTVHTPWSVEKEKCNLCGCYMPVKATLKIASCPAKKW